MATKTYRALRKGYVDGRVIEEGEVFSTEFKEIVREAPDATAMKRFEENGGAKPIGDIKRNKDGSPVTKSADAPSWAEPLDKNEVKEIITDPDTSQDPNFEEMQRGALEAYAAERHIQFTKKTSDDDLIAAIKAAPDPTR